MGTSTVHRSPNTGRWRYVASMYRDAELDSARLLSEILNAATGYVDGLADSAVRARLETLVGIRPNRVSGAEDPVGLAAEIVAEAQAFGRARGLVSFYGDLADRALFATITRAGSQPDLIAEPAAAVRTFTGELLGFAVDHLVSRDLSAHLGEGTLPNVATTTRLRGRLVASARALADETLIGERASAAAESPGRRWRGVVKSAWLAGQELPRTE